MFEVNQVSYAHPMPGSLPHRALRDISFKVERGEFISIVGANGSGKTTLARHLNGLLIPMQGSILVDGLDTRLKENLPQVTSKVGMVFQHPQEQMIATTIEEDVAFGPENMGLSTAEIRARVKNALTEVEMWDQRKRSPQYLSAGQMQRVALAGILAMEPDCIIFDEATAMLDPAGRDEVLKSITRLHANGITIITISHFMEEATLADRILGLCKGKLIYDGSPQDLFTNSALITELNIDKPRILAFAEQLRHWIPSIKSPLTVEAFSAQISPNESGIKFPDAVENSKTKTSGPLFLEAHDLSFTYVENTPLAHTALQGIDLQIMQGGFHGLIGATGSGKSTLLQHFNGLYLPQTGSLRVGPFNIDRNTDLLALRRFAGIVFQNPNYQLFEQYVGDEIAYGPRLMGIRGAELRQQVQSAMALVGLDFDTFKDRMTMALSGGEKRKVALASTIVLNPTLLLLDEPTAGLDPVARREILAHMRNFHASGKTMVISSHQIEDLALLTDHVTLLSNGKVVESQVSATLLSNHPLLINYNMTSPIATKMAVILREKGWMVPGNIITSQQLLASFEKSGQ